MSYRSVQQYRRRSSSDNNVNRFDSANGSLQSSSRNNHNVSLQTSSRNNNNNLSLQPSRINNESLQSSRNNNNNNGTLQTSRRRAQHQSFRSRDIDESTHSPVQEQKPSLEKIQVQPPFSVFQFFGSVFLFLCKLYLHFPTNLKVPIYLISVFVLSAAGDLLRPPRKWYLSRPDNLVNLFFVKFANFWTFFLLTAYVTLTSFLYFGGKKKSIFGNFCRILIDFFFSISMKFVFKSVNFFSGFCSNEDFVKEKEICLREGHRWLSFEVSEEVFFLIFCSLIIMEEVKNFSRWESLDFALQKDSWNVLVAPKQTAKNVVFAKKTYSQIGFVVKFLFFLLTIFSFFFDLFLLINAFFYQNLPQKLVASLSACLIWFLTYHLWYPHAWPGLPGIGMFRELPKVAKK